VLFVKLRRLQLPGRLFIAGMIFFAAIMSSEEHWVLDGAFGVAVFFMTFLLIPV
jgi:hypothetical protein